MLDEEALRQAMEETLSKGIQAALDVAAALDDIEESDAIMIMACKIIEEGQPAFLMAVSTSALAIRWHRTRQTEAMINNPAPGR